MRTISRRVRLVALLWLFGQAASLSAFALENCCVSHLEERAAGETDDACHESEAPPAPAPGDACPMAHGDGDACPMHGGNAATGRCAMTNACDGPGAQLLSMFAYLGAIEPPITSDITLESAAAIVSPGDFPIFRFTSPDAPPPKA